MSTRMKARGKPFPYRGNKIAAGEVFKVKPYDIRTLAASQLADVYDDGETEAKSEAAVATPDAAPEPANKAKPEPAPKDSANSEKPLASHTVPELKAMAAQLGIDIPSGANKGDILAKIRRSPRYFRRDMRAE